MNVESKIWILSCVVSAILASILFMLWVEMNRFEGDPTQLHDKAAVTEYFEAAGVAPTYRVKTGVYIQSLEYMGATDVNVSGYVWQLYEDGVHDAIEPAPGEIGFILPERVNAGDGVIEEAYRLRRGNGDLIGWYFEQTLRQIQAGHFMPEIINQILTVNLVEPDDCFFNQIISFNEFF